MPEPKIRWKLPGNDDRIWYLLTLLIFVAGCAWFTWEVYR